MCKEKGIDIEELKKQYAFPAIFDSTDLLQKRSSEPSYKTFPSSLNSSTESHSQPYGSHSVRLVFQ